MAISRFDNETGNPSFSVFADTLTDNLVEQLTAQSNDKYRVIGNAQILRLPRDQRNLRTIASSLNASHVVLGQIQSSGGQIRVLAHLIRLSDQTHIWVVRVDDPANDILHLDSQLARKIATEFSARLSTTTGAEDIHQIDVNSDMKMYAGKMYTYPPQLNWTRKGTMTRALFHLGNLAFYPAGAPAVRIRFSVDGNRVAMAISDGNFAFSAVRNTL